MGYNRLTSPASTTSSSSIVDLPADGLRPPPVTNRKKCFAITFTLAAVVFLLASAVSAAVLVIRRSTASGASTDHPIHRRPTSAIDRTCSLTTYPKLCVNSLINFPGAAAASSERDLIPISINATLQRFHRALYGASAIAGRPMHPLARSAYDACVELMETSAAQLSQSLAAVAGKANADDVLTWLSAAATNQDTCGEGLAGVEGPVKLEMEEQLRDLGELVSNCLAIFAASKEYLGGVPIQDRRRRRLMGASSTEKEEVGFPAWVRRGERRLMMMPTAGLKADYVVSKDGKNCTHTTIEAAIKAVPENSSRRLIIYVRAGRYDETLKVGRKKTNIMFVGDGKGQTVIAGSRNIYENLTTFHTATFAATGTGFIARDITFQNWAGPEKHQAVALRVGADHAVVYRCSIIGYQDTLYVHSQRQFFRECDVYGTVDFIFGNAAVVFQNCSLFARKPMPLQKNTITAQNRKDPNTNTGISIHNCRVLPTPDLAAAKSSFPTYLGRPWKLYSRVVYLMSYMGDHVHPAGWLPWNTSDFALDTLYYGEYMNYGPGGAVGMRVKWPGYRVITMTEEASKFTVAQFIYGSSWIPSTGVQFTAGLAV